MTDEHDHPTFERHCDVAVIGGSAAGLAAALQLARQHRSVIVVDDGTPRNAPAEHMHGYLGQEGSPASGLVALGREEVRSYGGEVLSGRAVAVHPGEEGRFRVELTGGHRLFARRVLATTGLVDELPDIEGVAEHWGRGVIHCPFCEGFEVRDQRVVQIVTHPLGLHPSSLYWHLAASLTLLLHGTDSVEDTDLERLRAAGVPCVRADARTLVTSADGSVAGVELQDGRLLEADAIVVAPRFHGRAEVLAAVGVSTTPHPNGLGDVVEIDPQGQTVVPGVFAAGNLTDPAMQVLQAAAHGSRTGAMIAFSLADEDLGTGNRTAGSQADWDHRYGAEDWVWSSNPNGTLVAETADLEPGRALDVGAGEGADALWLAERGWDTTAADISGNALARVRHEAERRGLSVRCLHVDAGDVGSFEVEVYDLVSAQYASLQRTPDQRGLHSLLGAVAPGGTLLLVGHDLAGLGKRHDATTQSHMFDADAYVGVERVAGAIRHDPTWRIETYETRARPPGAASTHHVNDVVLRAVKLKH